MTTGTQNRKIHEGRNVKRFREMLGIKQDALAISLGDDWNQQRISLLEQKEEIEMSVLQQISSALNIPVEAIKNMDDDYMINIVTTTFNDHSQGSGFSYYPVFNGNPTEKWLEALEEIKRLNAELVKVKDEQIQLLKNFLTNNVK